MLNVFLKSLWSHKRRLVGTFLAVLLGVAFLSGTLVLGDTLRANFDTLFTSVTGDTGAVVRSATKVSDSPATPRGPIDGSLAGRVGAVPGASAVQPVVDGLGQIVGRDGKVISTMGPPLASTWIADQRLTPYRLAEGRAPQTPDEVVINRGAAKTAGLHPGDRTIILTPRPVPVTVVGIATFQNADGFGGSSYTGFTLEGAQRHLAKRPGQVTRILVAGAPGVSQDALARRRQVLTAVVREALAVGLVASVAGLAAGLGIASGLKALFAGFGFPLPTSGLVFKANNAAISVAVGVGVTLLAGALPALRASRVAPLAALREVAAERGASARRAIAGAALAIAGVAVVVTAVPRGGDAVTRLTAVGAVLTMAGVVVLGAVVARPASRLIGAPLPRLRGITGALARQNAMRNPRRTAGAAVALLVGIAVVTLFTAFTASLQASIRQSVSSSFGGDLVIASGGFVGGRLDPRLAGEVGRLPEVRLATGISTGNVAVAGSGQEVSVAAPRELAQVLEPRMVAGSVRGLGDRQLAVTEQVADGKGWRLGTAVPVRFADGATESLTVGAIYRDSAVLNGYLLPRAAWAPHAAQDVDATVLVGLRDGVGLAAGRAAVERVAARYGSPAVRDRQQYADTLAGGVRQGVAVVYVMLALAIVIALLGIANTLSLSIHERTRELGLLRAVGETRQQVRAMVRWESLIVALFGTVGGLGLGAFLGWALVRAAEASDALGAFALPPLQLTVVLLVGALAGVLAGLRPARRAARLDLLAAIAAE